MLVRASDVEPEAVEWLWPGRIPFGKVTLLEGDPGVGKSTIGFDLAARLVLGNSMPDGSKPAMAGGVIVLSAEDGASDTIRPRLEAAGATLHALKWVGIVEGVAYPDGTRDLVTLPDHLEAVRAAITAITARLVIVDPLAAYLGGRVNTHRDHHIRRALAPLHQLANETGAAVLISRHLNKSLGGSAMYRGGGSIGIIGAARSALLAALDPDDAGSPEEERRRRVLAVVKSNLCRRAPSLSYRMVEADNGAVRIEWLGQSQHGADALVAVPADDEERSALDEACHFLVIELADGPRTAKQVRAAARDVGVTDRTLDRAKSIVGVLARRTGGLGDRGSWVWSLATKNANGRRPDPLEPPENAKDANSTIYGGLASLGADGDDYAAVERGAIQDEEGA